MARSRQVAVTVALLCAMEAVSFSQAALKNRIAQPIDSSRMVRLQRNVSPLTQVGTDMGPLNGGMQLKGISLFFEPSPSQKADLQKLIAEQQDVNSPNYHKWLTPEQYADRYGLSSSDVSKVSDWLRSVGLTVSSVNRTRDLITFAGTVGQVESIFRTDFHRYQLHGETHFANATEPSLPEALVRSGALGLRNLNDFRLKPRARKISPRFTSNVTGNTFLAPADVATIYDINALYPTADGAGQAIAVVGQTAINPNDVTAFRSASGLPPNAPQLVLMPGTGASTIVSGDEVESDLDVEWAGAIARNAKIIFVFTGSSQSFGVVDALFYAIDNNLAPIISISYGGCEPQNPGFILQLETELPKANSFGQTITSAVGDEGATDCEAQKSTIATHGLAVDVPAVLPQVTGVGGTTFSGDLNNVATYWNSTNDPSTNGSAIKYIPETTWNDSDATGLSSTGGGVSTQISKPNFQSALTPADQHRDVPDIALSASPNHDPYLFCNAGSCVNGFRAANGGLAAVGGTSAGAPIFAGMLALINQASENSGGAGNANINLYALAGSPSTYASAFHDVTSGNNKQMCQGGSSGCTSANSHVIADSRHSGLPFHAALFLIPVGAVVASVGRKRWSTVLGIALLATAFSVQIACGGGSSTTSSNTPPPNLSIGWSAGPGYDVTTGLGSIDVNNLANAWPGFTTSPAFQLDQAVVTSPTTSAPGTYTITLTRTSSGFSGNINLTCVGSGDATGDPLASCTLNPTVVTLNSGTPATSTLTVNAAKSGTYLVFVKGQNGAISHSVNVPITVP